jgi:hypothetical protein
MEGLGVAVGAAAIVFASELTGTERKSGFVACIFLDWPPAFTGTTREDGSRPPRAITGAFWEFTSGSVLNPRPIQHRLGKGEMEFRSFATEPLAHSTNPGCEPVKDFPAWHFFFLDAVTTPNVLGKGWTKGAAFWASPRWKG